MNKGWSWCWVKGRTIFLPKKSAQINKIRKKFHLFHFVSKTYRIMVFFWKNRRLSREKLHFTKKALSWYFSWKKKRRWKKTPHMCFLKAFCIRPVFFNMFYDHAPLLWSVYTALVELYINFPWHRKLIVSTSIMRMYFQFSKTKMNFDFSQNISIIQRGLSTIFHTGLFS